MKPRGRTAGLTLIELVIAIGLSSLVLLGLASVWVPVLGTQVTLSKSAGAQGQSLLGYKGLVREVSGASEVYDPPPPAALSSASDTLSGCSNYSSAKGAGAQGLLDPSASNESFYFCVDGGGTLYMTTRTGSPAACPMAPPACGAAPAMALAQNVSHIGATPYFRRPAGQQDVVEVNYEVGSGDSAHDVSTTIAFESSSGVNQ